MRAIVKTLVMGAIWGTVHLGAAQPAAPPLNGYNYALAEARKMNGIDPKAIGNFWEKWHLVTTRFRQDVREQRFIYANPIAWRAIVEGRSSYPDGSIFGKVAYSVKEDSSFTNSLEPFLATRIQLMRKSAADYKSTNGWGYALYLPASNAGLKLGDRGFEDIKDQMVCHACHTAVKERDYVFSRSPVAAALVLANPSSGGFASRFHPKKTADLSEYDRAILKEVGSRDTIQYAAMPLFVGSLVEAAGPLSKLALQKGDPYMLVDDKYHEFIVAQPDSPNGSCGKPARVVRSALGIDKIKIWVYEEYCDGAAKPWSTSPVPPAVAKLESEGAAPPAGGKAPQSGANP